MKYLCTDCHYPALLDKKTYTCGGCLVDGCEHCGLKDANICVKCK